MTITTLGIVGKERFQEAQSRVVERAAASRLRYSFHSEMPYATPEPALASATKIKTPMHRVRPKPARAHLRFCDA